MRSPQNTPQAKSSAKFPVPQVVFLDAVGTLFSVRGSVGFQYAQVAAEFGMEIEPRSIDRAFYHCFQAAPKMAFSGAAPADIPHAEYEWWRSLAVQTFEQTGDLQKFADFDQFFQSLYEYFATAKPWTVFEDTAIALQAFQAAGITLSLLSNFDSRLYRVIQALDLANYFAAITISTEVGAAKPETGIFELALAKHDMGQSPELAWHIGDSFKEDYQGAITSGIQAFWLNRDRHEPSDPQKQSANTIHLLTDLIPKLDSSQILSNT